MPRSVSDAIYGRVQGAEYDTNEQLWLIPCDQMLNISFNFGGVNFPIHPLDTVSSDFNVTDSSGKTMCVGTVRFFAIHHSSSLVDFTLCCSSSRLLPRSVSSDLMILFVSTLLFKMLQFAEPHLQTVGMGFLRNTYTLLDFGNFVDGTSDDTGAPYVQLLPLTDPTAAHADFVKLRLNGQDTTGDPSKALLPTSQMQHSPESESERKAHYEETIISRWPYILAGCLAFVVLVVGLCIWRCCCRRGGRMNKKSRDGILAVNQNSSYAPLHNAGSTVGLQPMHGHSYGGGHDHSGGGYGGGSY